MTDYLDIFLEEREMKLGNDRLKPVIKDGFQTLEVDKKQDNIDYLMPYLPALQKIHEVKDAVSEKLLNIPKAIEKGLIKGGLVNPLHYILGDNKYVNALDNMTEHEAQGLAESFAFEGSKFFGSYLGIGKLLKLGKAKKVLEKGGKFLPEALRVTGSTFLGYKGKEENLADAYTPIGKFAKDIVPALEDIGFDPEDVPQFIEDLQTNPDDSETLARLKNVIADGPLEAIGLSLGYVISKGVQGYKSVKQKKEILQALEDDTKKLFDNQSVGSAFNPNGDVAKSVNHITTQDAVINYVQSPKLYPREELVQKLQGDKIALHKSIDALENEVRYNVRDKTIKAFRVVELDENGLYRQERYTSLSLSPEGLLRSMEMGGPQALPSGKNSILVSYDLPIEERHILGYLPAIGEYTHGTQARLQRYNKEAIEKIRSKFGGRIKDGELKNTKEISNRLLAREKEIIANVDGIKPEIVQPYNLKANSFGKKYILDNGTLQENVVKQSNANVLKSYKADYEKNMPNALEGNYVQDIMEGRITEASDLPNNFTVSPRNEKGQILDSEGKGFENVDEGNAYEMAQKQQYIDYYKNIFNPNEYRNVDANNFYLKSETAINKLNMQKGNGGAFYNQLKKLGVKDDELYWLGLDHLKGSQAKTSKSALRKLIHNNLMDLKYMHSIPQAKRPPEYYIGEYPTQTTKKATKDIFFDISQNDILLDELAELTSPYVKRAFIQYIRDIKENVVRNTINRINNTENEYNEFQAVMLPEIKKYIEPMSIEAKARLLNNYNEYLSNYEGKWSYDKEKGVYVLDTFEEAYNVPKIKITEDEMPQRFADEVYSELMREGDSNYLLEDILPDTMAKLYDMSGLENISVTEVKMPVKGRKGVDYYAHHFTLENDLDDLGNNSQYHSVYISEYTKGADPSVQTLIQTKHLNNPNPPASQLNNNYFLRRDEAQMNYQRFYESFLITDDIQDNVMTDNFQSKYKGYQREQRSTTNPYYEKRDKQLNYQEHMLNAENFRGSAAYVDVFGQTIYSNPHFPNSLHNIVHFRTEDRFLGDKKFLYPFEIQSDWGQQPARRFQKAVEQEFGVFNEQTRKQAKEQGIRREPHQKIMLSDFQDDLKNAKKEFDELERALSSLQNLLISEKSYSSPTIPKETRKPSELQMINDHSYVQDALLQDAEPYGSREVIDFVRGAKKQVDEIRSSVNGLKNHLLMMSNTRAYSYAIDNMKIDGVFDQVTRSANSDKIASILYDRYAVAHTNLIKLFNQHLIAPSVAMPNYAGKPMKDIGIYKAIANMKLSPEASKKFTEIQLRYANNKNGYYDGPFINDTSKFTKLAIKKLLTLAHNGNYDGIIFRPGYLAKEIAGAPHSFYSKVIPDVANKVLADLGESQKVSSIKMSEEFETDIVHANNIFENNNRTGKYRDVGDFLKKEREYFDRDLGYRSVIQMTPSLKAKIQKGLSLFSVGGLAITSAEGDNESK